MTASSRLTWYTLRISSVEIISNPLGLYQHSIGLSLMKAGGSGTTCLHVYSKVLEIEVFVS